MKQLVTFISLFYSIIFYSQNSKNETISEENRIKLIVELSKLSGTEIDKSKIIVLNFYLKPKTEPNGSCIDYYTNDGSYRRFIKKRKNVIQFFITEKLYSYKGKNILEDKNEIIKKIAFENAEYCGNYIIINERGELIRKYGEYKQEEIPKLLEKI